MRPCDARNLLHLLLLLFLFCHHSLISTLAYDLNRDGILCIKDSKEESALKRWLECLDPSGLSTPDDAQVTSLQPPMADNGRAPSISGSGSASSSTPASIASSSVADGAAAAKVPSLATCPANQETKSSSYGGDDQDSALPDDVPPSSLLNTPVAEDGGASALKQLKTGASALEQLNPALSMSTCPIGNGEPDAIPSLAPFPGYSLEHSEKESISQVERTAGPVPPEFARDQIQGYPPACAEQSNPSEKGESDALANVFKLNLGVIALSALTMRMRRRQERNLPKESHSQNECMPSSLRSKADGMTKDIEVPFGLSKESANRELSRAGLQCLNFLAPLGSAVGAVFAEVLLHANHSGRPCLSGEELSMLLETAMKESLPEVVSNEWNEALRDFLSSFRTTYKTIGKVRNALSVSCQGFGERTCSCSDVDHGRPECSKQGCSCNTANKEFGRTKVTEQVTQVVDGNIVNQSWEGHLAKCKSEKVLSVLSDSAASRRQCECTEVSSPSKVSSNLATAEVPPSDDFTCTDRTDGGKYLVKEEDLEQEHPMLRRHPLHGNDGVLVSSFPSTKREECKETSGVAFQGDSIMSVSKKQPEALQSAGILDALVLGDPTSQGVAHSSWQKTLLRMFEKSVHVQEQHNYIKSVELAHLFKRLTLDEEQLQLTCESNDLMRENLNLSRLKSTFKESTVVEQRLNAAHIAFSRTCADELVAGLFVMLLALAHSVRHHSFALLNDVVSTCHPVAKEPRRSLGFHIDWLYNSLDSMVGQLHMFTCQVTVAGRIFIGLLIVAVVAASLLRQSVTSSSQSMPATIIIIVLGGVCGFAGKLSVDSLGGSGLRWLLIWEIFCLVHAIATCFTPFVYALLNGAPTTGRKHRLGIPFWFRRFSFHFMIVLVIPVLAGQLPFGTLSSVANDFLSVLASTAFPAFSWLKEWVVTQLIH